MRPLLALSTLLAACVDPVSLFTAEDSGSPDAGAPSRGVTAVAAGEAHTCAVRDGGLYCWGDNSEGQLGLGDLSPRDVPVAVGASSDWRAVSLGDRHTCAIRGQGDLYCWGSNSRQQLGVGDGPARTAPVRIMTTRAVAQVSARYDHTCAIYDDESLWCWGNNGDGQLGFGETGPGPTVALPTQVQPGTRWIAVSSGERHTCGLQPGGTLWCWGNNQTNQLGLGDGMPAQVRLPARVGMLFDWLGVSAGASSSCAVRPNELYCWGPGFSGTPRPAPLLLADGEPFDRIEVSSFGACAMATGKLGCWGRNVEGQLGNGGTGEVAVPAFPDAPRWRAVAVGRFHRCVIDPDEVLLCNGEGANGRLGLGDQLRRMTPTDVHFP